LKDQLASRYSIVIDDIMKWCHSVLLILFVDISIVVHQEFDDSKLTLIACYMESSLWNVNQADTAPFGR
jgi:hypothetical protein